MASKDEGRRPSDVSERISDDAPLRLAEAVRIAFPMGGMTVSGLRKEASRGRLVVEMIAGKQFTTLANINEMRRLCRVTPVSERASVLRSDIDPDTNVNVAREALRYRLRQLRKPAEARTRSKRPARDGKS